MAHIKNFYFFCESSSTSIPRSFLQLLKGANWNHYDFPLTAMTGTSKHVVPNNDADTPLDILFLQISHLANRRSCRASCQRPQTDRQTLDCRPPSGEIWFCTTLVSRIVLTQFYTEKCDGARRVLQDGRNVKSFTVLTFFSSVTSKRQRVFMKWG